MKIKHDYYTSIVKDIQNRMANQRKNCNIIFLGESGSGKSWGALELARLIDPTFNVEERVGWRPNEFLEIINRKGKKRLKTGQVCIWDEAGVGIPSTDWHSLSNKVLSHVFQTFRYRKVTTILTVPNINFIDNRVRKMINAIVDYITIDYDNNYSEGGFYWVRWMEQYKSFYRQAPRKMINGYINKCKLVMKCPPKYLTKPYEKKSKIFKDWVSQNAENEVERVDSKMKITTNDEYVDMIIKHCKESFRYALGQVRPIWIEIQDKINVKHGKCARLISYFKDTRPEEYNEIVEYTKQRLGIKDDKTKLLKQRKYTKKIRKRKEVE